MDKNDGAASSVHSDALLGPKHTGMRVSCSGLLGRLAHGGRCAKGERYMLGELLKHLEHVGREYYAGNVTFVDEFLQCYCLDDHRPNTEAQRPAVAGTLPPLVGGSGLEVSHV